MPNNRKLTATAIAVATAVVGLFCAPPAHAEQFWAGIAYDQAGNTHVFHDLDSQSSVTDEISSIYGNRMKDIVFTSGHCGAVVKIIDGNTAIITAGVGADEPEAFTNAVHKTIINPLTPTRRIPVKEYCQK